MASGRNWKEDKEAMSDAPKPRTGSNLSPLARPARSNSLSAEGFRVGSTHFGGRSLLAN